MAELAAIPSTCAVCGAGLDYAQAFCRTTRDGVPVALCSARCASTFLGGAPQRDGLVTRSASEQLVEDWRWKRWGN